MTKRTCRRTPGSPNVQSSPTGSRNPVATGQSEPFLDTTALLGATTSPLPPSQDMVRDSERWKKSAQEAAMRACDVEAALKEAKQNHEAERVAFEERVARLERQVSEAEHRANDSKARITQITQESAQDAAKRARAFEAVLAEASQTHAAEQVAFERRAAQLKRQVSEAEHRANDSEARVTQITQELRDSERRKKSAQDAAMRSGAVEAALEEVEQRHVAERVAFEERVGRLERKVSQAERRANDSEARATQIAQELRQTKIAQQQMAALLDTRSAELQDAQVYLTGLDDATDTETLRLVESINSRLFQAAATIADAFQSRYGEQKDIQVSQEAAARVRHLFGDDLLHALSSIDHSDESLVVQTALQAVMVSCAKWLCNTWDFDVAGPEQVLQKVYYFIRRTERQSVAGRWRALGRTYVKMFLKDDAVLERTASDTLVDHITDVLLIRGIAAEPQDLRMEVANGYADVLRGLVHLSCEFQRTTGEGIISRDLLVTTTDPEEPFDPTRMVDEWADPRREGHSAEPIPVLCTTQLGLVREERRAAKGTGDEEGIAEVVLLKPKVVLTSLLEELSNESDRVPYKA